MASWMPAFVQKRLLRYALSHVGLLDVDALDLDSLGIHIGSSSTVELKNVGLRLDKLSSLLQLPPNVRLLAARVLLLRLTVPANFFQQSIVAQVDGIDVQVAVDDPPQSRDTDDIKTPQHRKTNRRLHSPPLSQYDPGGRVLSTQQLAQSFLQDEPLEEKQELEARYMAKSFSSDTSDESAVGTGTGLGLPGALAGFLQGIIDRVQVRINNVNFRLSHQELPSEHASTILAVKLDSVDVQAAISVINDPPGSPDGTTGKRRRISIQGFGVHLLSKEQPSQTSDSPYASFVAPPQPSVPAREDFPSTISEDAPTLQESATLPPTTSSSRTSLHESMSEDIPVGMSESTASFGIRPGEDNISWTSRRSQGSSDHDQLWSSFAPDEQQSGSDILQDMSSSMFLSTIDTRQSSSSSPNSQVYTSPTGTQSPEEIPMSSSVHHSQLTVGEHQSTMEASVYDPSHFQESPATPTDEPDLSQSIMYSHAEAESMYMSAVTHEPGSPNLAMLPGQWNSSLDDVDEMDPPFLSQHLGEAAGYESEDRAPTPRLQHSPEQTDSGSKPDKTAPNYVSRNIVTMQDLTIWIHESSVPVSRAESGRSTESTSNPNSMGFSTFHHQAPGAFSVYAESARSSVRFHAPNQDDEEVATHQEADETEKVIEVDAGPIDLQADTSTLGLLHQMVTMVVPTAGSVEHPVRDDIPTSDQRLPRFILRLGLLRVRLLQALPEVPVKFDDLKSWAAGVPIEVDQKVLLRAEVHKLDLQTTTHSPPLDGTLHIGKLILTAGTCDVVSFDRSSIQSSDSRAIRRDITVTVRSKSTVQRQLVREVDVRTLPIRLNLDLVKFDEDFSAFGGLSGIMEVSSSVLSSGISSNKQESLPQPRRSVRFEEEALPDLSNSPQLKLNARIGGFNATLTSYACCLDLQASKTKLVYREKAVAAVIDKVNICMLSPSASPSHPDFDVMVGNLNLFYFFSPESQDLERLLSLLTPSNDKYENDDDILLDTLLNQRRKGSVLRVNVSTLQTSVTDWSFISHLQLLGEELSKLSAVTKYLPEDDRPGMLILARISNTRVQFPLNARFGLMDISLKDFQAAQVGLPALYALSIGSIRISPAGGDPIVHELLPSASSEHLPMLMARMVGDEAEPVAKIKFFNACVEYSVPVLLAMTDTNTAPEAEQKVEDLAASVLEMSSFGIKGQTSAPEDASKSSDGASKKLAIDVLLHECGLGLKPRELDAKGLVLLKNTKFSTVVPPDECFEATLELREASLYIVDLEQMISPVSPASPNRAYHPDYPRRLHTHLINHGYVSASSIRSAKAVVSVTEDKLEKTKYIDVELRDEFFLLETCADSTQTLIAILNGLAPPAPPSVEPKFRTEMDLMTLDDMVNSLSGDAFVRPGSAPSALFDADEELPLPEEDELLVESDMTASLYGPVDATGLEVDDDDLYGGGGLESDTVESLLEQDPFEMTSSPQLNDDTLMHSLKKQLALFSGNKPVTLRPCYLDDRQLDKIYGGHKTVGEVQEKDERFPIQVRIRDVNIMWNLYDGYDWQKTRDAISHAVEEVETRLEERKLNRRRSTDYEDEEEAIIGDCLFNSIYIGVPSARDPAELRYSINQGIDVASETESYATSGISRPTQTSSNRQARSRHRKRLRLHRSKSHKLGFELKGVSLDFLAHPPGSGEIQSSVDVRVRDFDIFDHVPTSTWRKFLTFYHDENNLREMMKPMIHIELLNVRPVPELAATEMTIQASLLPLRLHVDQDALEFMTRFFDFKDDSLKNPEQNAEPPFIQRLEVNTVDLCLDYKPKKVDYGGLRSGRVSEFKNFVILDTAHVQLKHAIVYGLRGFDTLHDTLSDIWTPDVIQHQLRGVLAGLGPVRPLVSLGAGVRDVVAIPVREYRKDGRLVRSVQKGAFHFAKTTTSELARLGAKLAIGTQTMLQGAEDMLSPTSASPSGRSRGLSNQGLTDVEEEYEDSQRVVSNYADQPLGVLQGLRSARRYLERDLLTARDAFIAVQGELLDSGSAAGAAQAVARHAPTIVLRPVIGASRAVGQTLMGVGNQVDRTNVRKIEDKYKRR